MKIKYLVLTVLSMVMLPTALTASEPKKSEIHFAKGKSQRILSGKITGHNSAIYQINAQKGQWLKVEMLPGGKGADFIIKMTGKKAGEGTLFNSFVKGRKYLGQLSKKGSYTIEVYLNRAAAGREETHSYRMLVSVTNSKPAPEEKSSS